MTPCFFNQLFIALITHAQSVFLGLTKGELMNQFECDLLLQAKPISYLCLGGTNPKSWSFNKRRELALGVTTGANVQIPPLCLPMAKPEHSSISPHKTSSIKSAFIEEMLSLIGSNLFHLNELGCACDGGRGEDGEGGQGLIYHLWRFELMVKKEAGREHNARKHGKDSIFG